MVNKVALITGITGQDGSYLARLLLNKGYEVHGLRRHSASDNNRRITDLLDTPSLHLHDGDVLDYPSLARLVEAVCPDEVYHLAAQSHVQLSFAMADYTANVNALGTLRMLETLRNAGLANHTRFYQASTSELYGKTTELPQNETTAFAPVSPYSVAKLYAYWAVCTYRESYEMHASNGILFNHESPLRGDNFVTQKIAQAVAHIARGANKVLELGNLNAQRDWGHAKDYVEGMYRIVQHEKGDDFVLATGQSTSVRRFVELAFEVIDQRIEWHGEGHNETGHDARSGETRIRIHPDYFRPTEVHNLVGDYSKAKKLLGWSPAITLGELIDEMVHAAIARLDSIY